MNLFMHVCPPKFQYFRRRQATSSIRILDIGCGNHSPTITKHWFPGCFYAGADIQRYNNSNEDMAAMYAYYFLGDNGSDYSGIPDGSFDFIILNHVIEHMENSMKNVATICSKLKPGGYIWIAFPSVRTLSLPPAQGTLQFCDDSTHIFVPDIREVSNVLLAHGVNVLHATRSRDFLRELIGAVILPWKLLKRRITGKFTAKGLWFI